MKKVLLSIAVVAMIGMTSCKNQTEEKQETTETTEEVKEIAMAETTFGVRGNCGMCKRTIEEAANSLEGVATASWDVDRKKIHVSYDKEVVDEMKIHKAIAASGYDTDQIEGDAGAYEKLPECCQYDHEMEMNLTEPKDGEEGNHHHME
ncbi:MAG: heavy-metal-associated domain-containing protein [Flavobacteriaceae bacterium]